MHELLFSEIYSFCFTMIGFLKGTVALRDDPYLFIDVHGVGYKTLVSTDILAKAVVGELLTLYTYTFVRDDALELFGFLQYEDLKLFEKLIGVSGVGPKTAIQIFSSGTYAEILQAITQGNVAFFTSVPRLGKKNAQKIIIELRNKFTSEDISDLAIGDYEDVFQALSAFGFSQKEVYAATKSIDMTNLSTEQKIKAVLKYLGK